jgi:hypothetical protein
MISDQRPRDPLLWPEQRFSRNGPRAITAKDTRRAMAAPCRQERRKHPAATHISPTEAAEKPIQQILFRPPTHRRLHRIGQDLQLSPRRGAVYILRA